MGTIRRSKNFREGSERMTLFTTTLKKHKKIEYIKQILDEILNGSIDEKEDSILVEVASAFLEDIKKEERDGDGEGKN